MRTKPSGRFQVGYRGRNPIAVNLGFFLCLLESFEGRRFCRTPLEIAPVLEGAFYVVKGFKEFFLTGENSR